MVTVSFSGPDAPFTTSTGAIVRIDTGADEKFPLVWSKPPGPFVAGAGTR